MFFSEKDPHVNAVEGSTIFIQPAVHKIRKIMIFRHCKPPKYKNCILENFRLSEGYTYLRPVISNFQPTFYDQWFEMFCTILEILGTILTQKVGFAHLSA